MTAIRLGATLLISVSRGSCRMATTTTASRIEDERDYGEDNQDQRGKHQLSAPLLMI